MKKPYTYQAKNSAAQRKNLLGMVHIAATHADIDTHSEEYRHWLYSHSGAKTCTALSDGELAILVNKFKKMGLLSQKTTGNTPDRPTAAQWAKMETMARQIGYTNIQDAGFITWLKGVTKVENPRFLTRQSMSHVIAGLERWVAHKQAKATENTKQI